MCVISHRYAKATNSPAVADYDPTKPNKNIMYMDANDLGGWVMKQYLPNGGFEWSNITVE
jgi:hypothetical protein